MRFTRLMTHRLRSLFRRSHADADLQREIEIHFEQLVKEAISSGMSESEARLLAQREFGPLERTKEECRDMRRVNWIDNCVRDLRYALRVLAKNPGFTVVAVITLALGIAANTTIFSAVSAILLRKPPLKDPDSLCAISSKNLAKDYDLVGVSAPDFQSWQRENHVFAGMAAVESGRSFTLTGKNDPQAVRGDLVTLDYFRVIGVMPILGRAFLQDESQAGNNHVVILSNALWRSRFGADPTIVGQGLEVNGDHFTIAGVMPQLTPSDPQLWTPLVFEAEDLTPSARSNHYLNLVLGRLKAGVTVKQAQADMQSIAESLAHSYPTTNKDWGAGVLTLQEYKIRSANVRNGISLLMTVVGVVLLIACANIAGLLLARGAGRSHELAIRSAMGASRSRLLRQMLVENLLISAAGGALGVLLSIWGVQLMRAGVDFNEWARRQAAGFRLDQPTLLFALLISLLTSIVFGLLPAIRTSKANSRGILRESARTGQSLGSSRLRNVLVAGEISLALVLLTAASILIREFVHEFAAPNGFNPRHVLVANLDLNSRRYKDWNARRAFFTQVTEKLRSLPAVEAADVDSCIPMGCSFSASFKVVGDAPLPPSRRRTADFFVNGPQYFETMQIPLLDGRSFSSRDDAHSPLVAIVNHEFARRFFPKEGAIGKQIEVEDGNHRRAQIIGVAGNVNDYVGQISPRPQIYESYLQIPVNAFSTMSLTVRSRLTPATLAPMVRRAVWSVDKNQPVERIQTMDALVSEDLGGDKLLAGLMGIFAGLALALASVGTYGVIAYSVKRQVREIGIRMALGAQQHDVLSLVLRQGAKLTGIGCAIGMLLAFPLPRLFSAMFNGFAVEVRFDAIVVALLVALVSLLATFIPAYRAAKVDPIVALRHE